MSEMRVSKHDDPPEGNLELPTSMVTTTHTVSDYRVEGDTSVLQVVEGRRNCQEEKEICRRKAALIGTPLSA